MKDKKVFDSAMSSSRRFSDIKVDVFLKNDETAAKKIVAVVEKFKRHMKKFTVINWPRICSAEVLPALMNAATDVEELSMSIWRHAGLQKLKFFPKEEFSKLKHLSIYGVQEIDGILIKIPDRSLEGLTADGDRKRRTFSNIRQ